MERIRRQLEVEQQAQQNILIKEYKDNKHNLQQEIRTDIKRIASQYPGFKKYALYQIYKQFHFNRNIANEFISIQIKNDEEAQEDGWIEVGKAQVRIRSHSHNSEKIEYPKRDTSVPKRRPSVPKQKKFAVVYVPKTPSQNKISPTKRSDRGERSDRSDRQDRFERFDRQITPPQKQRVIIEYVPKSSVEQKNSQIIEPQLEPQELLNQEQQLEQEIEQEQEQQELILTEPQEQESQFDLSKQEENYIKDLLKEDNTDQNQQKEYSQNVYQTPIQPFCDVNYQPYYFYQNFDQEQSQLYHILLGYVKNQDLTY
ncbi:hypothetical protein pb186bvf_007972 [Paramecium bursaria]